ASGAGEDRVGLDTPPPSGSGGSTSGGTDAIDLGATVVPVLIKNYGKKIAIGVAVIAAVVIGYKLLRG
ncbi:carbon monoxide dehydrogenase, partial [Nocardioides sp. NPDC059952]